MDCNAERFEHHGVDRSEALRHRNDQLAVDPDPVRHCTVVRGRSDEASVRAKVHMAGPALWTLAAGLVRVDGDLDPGNVGDCIERTRHAFERNAEIARSPVRLRR